MSDTEKHDLMSNHVRAQLAVALDAAAAWDASKPCGSAVAELLGGALYDDDRKRLAECIEEALVQIRKR